MPETTITVNVADSDAVHAALEQAANVAKDATDKLGTLTEAHEKLTADHEELSEVHKGCPTARSDLAKREEETRLALQKQLDDATAKLDDAIKARDAAAAGQKIAEQKQADAERDRDAALKRADRAEDIAKKMTEASARRVARELQRRVNDDKARVARGRQPVTLLAKGTDDPESDSNG